MRLDITLNLSLADRKLLDGLRQELQAAAEGHHREIMAAIFELKETVSKIIDPAKLEAINAGLSKVADKIDAINAADQKAIATP